MSGKFRGNAGDWTCSDPHCANVNFARRDACNRCGVPREVAPSKAVGIEIGKAAAEKSKGLFSADDWQCSKCGNVNWARRSTCNVCNAPKVSDVEERTGYGGGYNEREGIEYVEREESDSEFDEFGRRKKKYRKSLPEKEKEKPAPPVETKEEDNEDDEEDDDDDDDGGDLSKYDLAGWSDLDDDKAKKDEPESDSKRDRRSRSRSSSSDSRSSRSSRSRPRSRSRSRSGSHSRDRRARSARNGRRRRDRSSSSRSRSRSRSHNRK